jgi:hypothetical protein
LLNKVSAFSPTQLASVTSFVGYDAYLYAATDAIIILSRLPPDPSKVVALGHFANRGIDVLVLEQPRLKLWHHASLASENAMSTTMLDVFENFGPVVNTPGLDGQDGLAPLRMTT